MSLVALLLLVTLLVAICTGCGATEAEAAEPDRFTVERAGVGGGADIYIITDNETGVQYLFVDSYYSGGLNVLQPAPAEEG